MNLLEVINLEVTLPSPEGPVRAVGQASFEIPAGDSLCLVGESGCGKTMIASAVMGLLSPGARIKGQILFRGVDLVSLPFREMQKIRGSRLAMIFEQPASCFNPVFTVGEQIAEVFRYKHKLSRREARLKGIELMAGAGLNAPEKIFGYYPHEFSGGMIQRAMIAMAMAAEPELLIADEPTTSLDVTIQAQIIDLLGELIRETGASLLLITHDLAVAARLCRRAAVMYAGSLVEQGPTRTVFQNPRHPYTRALLAAARGRENGLIPGSVPDLSRLPQGCAFHPRCPGAENICRRQKPEIQDGVRCHLVRTKDGRHGR